MTRRRPKQRAKREALQLERQQQRGIAINAADYKTLASGRVTIRSQYAGRCAECEGEIRAGEKIYWEQSRGIHCWACGPWQPSPAQVAVW